MLAVPFSGWSDQPPAGLRSNRCVASCDQANWSTGAVTTRRGKRFSFVYKPKGGPYKLALSFAKWRVEKAELVQVLKEVIKQLEAGEIKLPKR